MNFIKQTLFVFSLLSVSLFSLAQSAELLDALPDTKEEFIQSEKKVIATINWLENTPMDQEAGKRKQLNALLLAWIINSPTVTIEINSRTTTFTKKNSELLIFFMAGWTKYALENSYSEDNVLGSIAGIKSAIKVYKGGLLKKDKEMQKLIELDDKGELEKWVAEQLAKK